MSNAIQQLQEVLGDGYESGDEVLFHCPFCNHRKKKLSVNSISLCWKCWVCDQRGRSLFSLFWRLGRRELCDSSSPHANSPQPDESDAFRFCLPDEYEHVYAVQSSRPLRYLLKRGVSSAQILRHKIGYCHNGRYANRVVLPSFAVDGRPNFFTARAIGHQRLRYLNPQVPAGYKKSIVLNELNLDWERPVVLVEGFFDMLRVDNATPLYGSVLADDCKLFQELALRQCTAYVCLDSDARAKQLDMIADLNSYGVKAYDVKLPSQGDLAETPPDAIAEALECARPLDRVAILKERISCT